MYAPTTETEKQETRAGGGRKKNERGNDPAGGANVEYRICPYCGAALDPGERCDCRDREQLQEDIIITGSLEELAAQLEAEKREALQP